ncbi:MAG: hypothetical protein IRZ04_20880 [Rhodospirillales bacterium]|nr:hypothetical protein [Rhodospirillales bacterium]
MSWALVQIAEGDEKRRNGIAAEIYPADLARADDGGAVTIPNVSVSPAGFVRQEAEGFVIEAEADGPLDGIEPGPYAFLKDVGRAVAEYMGEACHTVPPRTIPA